MHRILGSTAAALRHARLRLILQVATISPPSSHLDLAARMDREADLELFAGHHLRAEHLAHRAAELRVAAQ